LVAFSVVVLGKADGISEQCNAAVISAGGSFDFPPKQPKPSVSLRRP
jgi:hypothetical protein